MIAVVAVCLLAPVLLLVLCALQDRLVDAYARLWLLRREQYDAAWNAGAAAERLRPTVQR